MFPIGVGKIFNLPIFCSSPSASFMNIDKGFDTLYKWAKDNKCDGIEALGRPGFWNWIKKEKGWKETSRFYELKFDKD